MNWLRSSLARMRGLLRKEQLDSELNDELVSHLEMHMADNVRAGMTPEEARRNAQIKLGGVEQTKETVRDRRGFPWLESFTQDARFGLRMLRKSPSFSVVAVLTLALGIGANTAIFSVVNAVLLRGLPFSKASELVAISARSTMFDFPNLGLSLPDIADLRSSAHSFVSLAISQDAPKELTGGGKPERIESSEVSEDFFPLLGIRPLQGRTFTRADMRAGTHVAVLRNFLWLERFGGEPAAIGKSIMLDGEPYTIVGVVPDEPALDFATDSKLWTAFIPAEEQRSDRSNHAYSVLARLKPGVGLKQAQSELDTIAARLATAYPDVDKGWSIHAASLREYLLGDARPSLILLFLAVGLVLLIACANVSNLFLSRGWARRREFAIRAAIGATRAALLRQLFLECLLVALVGGVCAFLLATWTIGGLRAMLPPGIPRVEGIRIDSEVAWFTLGASILAAVFAGLVPALLSTRQHLSLAIKQSGGGPGASGANAGHNVLRQLLVIGEVALAAILLIGATLAVRSFGRLVQLDLGFRPDHVIAMRLDFPKFRLANADQSIAFVQQILEGSRAVPGVESASTGTVFPLSDEVAETTFHTEESAKDPKSASQSALANRVATGYFQTLGIPLRAGRDFETAEGKGHPPVFVVNETLARKFFGSTDPVGKRIAFPKPSGEFEWGEIVGVAGDVREVVPGEETKPQIYAPYYQTPRVMGVYLMLRTKSDPLTMVAAAKDRIWAVDKNQPVSSVTTMDARIAEVNAAPRSQSVLLGIFGGLGFLLALVGVYGVMSYLVSLQTREIGIRMALGAGCGQILRSVLIHGLKLTLSGVFIGVAAGLGLTRFMSSLVFGIGATDPITFASVAASLTLVALAACYIPARRATRVDPMIALRYE